MKQLVSAAAVVLSVSTVATWAAGNSPADVKQIPLQRGLVLVSALHWEQGDRENVVTIEQQAANGVTYAWNTDVPGADGKPETLEFRRFVRAIDLQKASRLHSVYWTGDKSDYPGYTGWSLSTAVFDALLAGGDVPYMIVSADREQAGADALIAGLLRQTKRLRGSLRANSKDSQAFPLLYNGVRVSVPARRVSGKFAANGASEDVEFWVLADRDHPLILKSTMGMDVWQIVRIETPQDPPVRALEQQLSRNCRVEIPGIYFAFGTATIDGQSGRALAAVAQLLNARPDWSVLIEGHTDDIGSDAANMKLSQARADAVRTSLARNHAIAAGRLKAVGFGETRPRESNDTLEGRARNRRVELVRPCAAAT
jgi:outer membrane protein OmpA-like peptidoglycan-associated protein